MLSALLVSAFAAQSASAAVKGTTAFTCTSTAVVKDFKAAHCKESDKGGTAFGDTAITETTHFKLSNTGVGPETKSTSTHIFQTTVAGAPIKLTSPEMECNGTLHNKVEGPAEGIEKEHWIHGTKITCTFKKVKEDLLNCTVTGLIEPGKGVKEEVTTNLLTATTTGKGDSIVLQPEPGIPFTEFTLTDSGDGKCVVAPVTIKVFGSFTCKPNGATITCSHEEITAQKTFRIGNAVSGPFAGYEGEVTVTGGKEPKTEPTNPISVTTVETA
jgi:hypothetical protein